MVFGEDKQRTALLDKQLVGKDEGQSALQAFARTVLRVTGAAAQTPGTTVDCVGLRPESRARRTRRVKSPDSDDSKKRAKFGGGGFLSLDVLESLPIEYFVGGFSPQLFCFHGLFSAVFLLLVWWVGSRI